MKKLYNLKSMLFLILIILSTKVIIAQTCSISGSFNPVPETSYSYSFSCIQVAYLCTWTIVGDGYFVDGSGIKITDNKQLYVPLSQWVSIKWKNTPSYKSLSVTGSDNSGIQYSDTQKINLQYIAKPRFMASSPLDVYYNNTPIVINVYAVPNATKYVWSIPSGWSGPTTTQTSSNTVTPNTSLQPGIITCRAGVGDFLGDSAILYITRSLPPLELINPPKFSCGETAPLTYSVTPLVNATYSWTLPSGWSGASTTQTNSNTVTPNGINGGTLNVVAQVTDGNITNQTTVSHVLSLEAPPTLSFYNCPGFLCNYGSTTFSVTGAPANSTYTWETNNNVLIDGQPSPYTTTNNSVSLSAPSSSGNMTLSVSYINSCNQPANPKISMSAWIGTPDNINITAVVMMGPSSYQLCRNTEMTIAAGLLDPYNHGVASLNWNFGSWAPYVVGYETIGGVQKRRAILNLGPNAPSSQVISIVAANQCGSYTSPPFQKTFYAINCNTYSLSMTPNPANNETIVTLESNSQPIEEAAKWDIEIYSQSQILKEKRTNHSGKEFKVNTAGWTPGVYYVKARYKNDVLQGKIIKL